MLVSGYKGEGGRGGGYDCMSSPQLLPHTILHSRCFLYLSPAYIQLLSFSCFWNFPIALMSVNWLVGLFVGLSVGWWVRHIFLEAG